MAVLIRLYGLMLMVSQFSISSKLKLIYPQGLHSQTKLVKTLKKLGFKFVGSTIIYAYMQAIGIVNDHVKGCHLYANK